VIEDSEAGIAAAADAGMEVIAVRRGRGSDFARRATRSIDRLGDLRLRGAPEGFEVL
jgi:beta-phosphoglucomutase-like phosphatase (HAD superfamily)